MLLSYTCKIMDVLNQGEAFLYLIRHFCCWGGRGLCPRDPKLRGGRFGQPRGAGVAAGRPRPWRALVESHLRTPGPDRAAVAVRRRAAGALHARDRAVAR